jgi:hypothetical protein
MVASLVAELADVDLEGRRLGAHQRDQPVLSEGALKAYWRTPPTGRSNATQLTSPQKSPTNRALKVPDHVSASSNAPTTV